MEETRTKPKKLPPRKGMDRPPEDKAISAASGTRKRLVRK